MNAEYPNWNVWRSVDDLGRPAAWVATNRTRDSLFAPTLHGDTAEKLEQQLRNPPLAAGLSVRALKRAQVNSGE
ncbi:hypothetical protein [Marinactinospora rubrisoli]|uniref:Uncharacterized protein n=1 Tax=Marinactinospora rubrisoli TaxID=2715399 RepID=A0ABW2KA38_9ACTN